MTEPLKILTVCSHNRTRSVMTMAMLGRDLDRRLGTGAALVRSLGFGPEDLPSIPDAVAAMKRRGLDTSGHRSRQITAVNASHADLVLTSERDHVVKIAALSPGVYRRTMTLPEFLAAATLDAPEPDESLREYASRLTEQRTARDYISGSVEEIADPTGSPARQFERAVVGMEAMCELAAGVIAATVTAPPARNRFDFG